MKLLIPIGIIGVCIGMYLLYIRPTAVEVKSLSATKSEYANVLVKSKELKDQRDLTLTQYNSIPEEEVARLNKVLPEKFDPVIFANDITALARTHQVSLGSIGTANTKTEGRDGVVVPQGGAYKTNVVTLAVTGTYAQFIDFLEALESSLRLIDVVGLSVRSLGDSGTARNSLEYSVELNTYSLR